MVRLPAPNCDTEGMDEACEVCGGAGMQLIERADGSRAVRECVCRTRSRQQRALAAANIPRLYSASTLDNYETADRDNQGYTLNHAKYTAEKFVRFYPLETNGMGLLLTGSIGTGKTHLAVGVLKALIEERGATGIFFHFHDLIKKVQNSFNRGVSATEQEIMEPIFRAEVLVLDELGASKPSDWVFDTLAHILNTRYNERLTTILTTNYVNREPMLGRGRPMSAMEEAREALRNETLGDRIGERMRSRLQEMCMSVEMTGPDYRQTAKRAHFG